MKIKNPFIITYCGGGVLFLIAIIGFIRSTNDINLLLKATDALFTLSTVAFSSVMCVTFLFDFSGISSPEKRLILKQKIRSIRWLLIFCVLSTTITLITIDTSSAVNAWCALALILILTIGYFGLMAHLLKDYEKFKEDERTGN